MISDVIATLVRCEGRTFLCLGEVNGIYLNSESLDSIGLDVLPERTVSVSFSIPQNHFLNNCRRYLQQARLEIGSPSRGNAQGSGSNGPAFDPHSDNGAQRKRMSSLREQWPANLNCEPFRTVDAFKAPSRSGSQQLQVYPYRECAGTSFTAN
jgi:hypothetical protein